MNSKSKGEETDALHLPFLPSISSISSILPFPAVQHIRAICSLLSWPSRATFCRQRNQHSSSVAFFILSIFLIAGLNISTYRMYIDIYQLGCSAILPDKVQVRNIRHNTSYFVGITCQPASQPSSVSIPPTGGRTLSRGAAIPRSRCSPAWKRQRRGHASRCGRGKFAPG